MSWLIGVFLAIVNPVPLPCCVESKVTSFRDTMVGVASSRNGDACWRNSRPCNVPQVLKSLKHSVTMAFVTSEKKALFVAVGGCVILQN
jgi:hypothetical protein